MKTLLFFAAAFGTLQAAAITQIASCTYDGVITTGTDSCSAGGPGVFVSASTSITPSGDYNSGLIDWSWTGGASGVPNQLGTGQIGSATATITVSQDFYTIASARSGFA